MLGDSFTMGKGVANDQTFSALLEHSLRVNKVTYQGRPVEVLNAGVNSYAPILSYLQLTTDLQRLEPDLVVLNLDMSDLVQEMAYRRLATYAADGEIIGVDGRRPLATRVREWIDRNLFITRLILFYVAPPRKTTVEDVVTRANPGLIRHTLVNDTVDRGEQWRHIFDSIVRIKRYCDSKRIKFLLTVYPWGHQVSDQEWIPGRFAFLPKGASVSDKSLETIREFARNNDIDLLDVFPAFRAYRGGSRLYFHDDMHWTETGHKLMAEELERYIRATYFRD